MLDADLQSREAHGSSAGTTMAPPSGVAEARVPSLDGVRGLAIALVVIYHTTNLPLVTTVDHVWSRLSMLGWSGVTLFFVLSGYLITGILFDAKGDRHFFRNFYARRTVRIFPLYYGVVFFSLVLLPHIPHPKMQRFGQVTGEEWWYWTYLSNFLVAKYERFRHGILDVSWSLSIEEQFYLVWPFVVLLLNRRRLMWLCGLLIAGALAFRVAGMALGTGALRMYVLPFTNLDALAMGGWLALASRGRAGGGVTSRLTRFLPVARVVAPAGILLMIVTALYGFRSDPMVFGADWPTPHMRTVGYTVLAFVFGAFVVLALDPARSAWRRVFELDFFRTLGKYSYALYLFHLPLRAMIRDWVYPPGKYFTVFGSPLPGQILFHVLSLTLSLAVAWLSWHLYEKHFLKLKKYFTGTRPAGVVAETRTPGIVARVGGAEESA